MLDSILIKPAGPDCNLDCNYCFYKCKEELFKDSVHRMSIETLEKCLYEFIKIAKPESSICFQGGEPTLMGLSFFQYASEYIKKNLPVGMHIALSIQTNGILLDDDFCDFLARERWLVGLSIDGNKQEHDLYRKKCDGSGSFAEVSEAMKRLKRHGVDFNTLTVITRANVDKPKELFRFFMEYGNGYMQFIPCYEENNGVPCDFCCQPEQFGLFLCQMFDLWYDSGKIRAYIRFYEELLHSYVTLASAGCSYGPECIAAPVVEHTGDVYPCDFFVDKFWRLGNVNDDSLERMICSEKAVEFRRLKRDLAPECDKCKWRCICNGDCKKNRMPNGKSYFCQSYKMFFEYSRPRFLELKSQLLAGDTPKAVYYAGVNREIRRNSQCPCGSGRKYKKCCMPIKSA